MAKKDKKQKHRKKREQARKRQKARAQTQPKLLRKDPVLSEALNYRYPLVDCLINNDWAEQRFASVYIIRDAPSGLALSGFLVDLAETGLKDATGDCCLTGMDIEEILENFTAGGQKLITCDISLVIEIVHGGILWAKKWKFKLPKDYAVWLRLLPPVDQNEVSLDRFGENGKPILYLDEKEFDRKIEEKFDPRILSGNLEVDKLNIPPRTTLDRIRDIKSALVDFSHRSEFAEKFAAAANDHFGEKEPESDFEWINFQDYFVLQYKLEDDKTVLQRFVERYKKYLSNDVRQLLEGWALVVEGIFEIKDCNHDVCRMKNLINEREYTVYATSSMSDADFKPGYFATARIVRAIGFHLFSGAVSVSKIDGSLPKRAAIYKTAVEMQMKNPAKAFQDNDEKLQKSRDQVKKQYEDFIVKFGSSEVFGSGREILDKYQALFDYQVFEKVYPDTGLTSAEKYAQDTGESYKPPIAELPDYLLESDDVALLCDPEEGISFLIQYFKFIGIFENPNLHLGHVEAQDLLMEYLESESISDVPFRRAAERFPDNFKTIMKFLGEQKGFDAFEINGLMREFKPHSFNKLPTTVAVLDSEMTYLSRLADSDLKSEPGRLKKVWQKILGNKKKSNNPAHPVDPVNNTNNEIESIP